MFIHDALEEVLLPFKGQVLRTATIHSILKDKYPDINLNSVLPNDHAAGNKKPCYCASSEERIFDRIKQGRYKVR